MHGFFFLFFTEVHLLNFSRDCRNNYYGTAYNAAYAQNRKIHIPEGDSTSPITYRQNIGGSENDNWMANNSSAVRFTRECHPASEETTHLCNGNHNEEYIDSNTGLAGLAFALIVHAILEGLAIGLQTQIPEVREYIKSHLNNKKIKN